MYHLSTIRRPQWDIRVIVIPQETRGPRKTKRQMQQSHPARWYIMCHELSNKLLLRKITDIPILNDDPELNTTGLPQQILRIYQQETSSLMPASPTFVVTSTDTLGRSKSTPATHAIDEDNRLLTLRRTGAVADHLSSKAGFTQGQSMPKNTPSEDDTRNGLGRLKLNKDKMFRSADPAILRWESTPASPLLDVISSDSRIRSNSTPAVQATVEYHSQALDRSSVPDQLHSSSEGLRLGRSLEKQLSDDDQRIGSVEQQGIVQSLSTPSLPLTRRTLTAAENELGVNTEAVMKTSLSTASVASSSTLVPIDIGYGYTEALDKSKSLEKQHKKFRSKVTYTGDAMIKRKLVIVGDGLVGKTTLAIVFAKGTFPEVFLPTAPWDENYVADILVDDTHFELALWDTPGIEDWDRLRPLSYPDSHVILICFAIDHPDSLANVWEKWISEILHFCEGLPIMLVGLKKELRKDPRTIEELLRVGQHPVTTSEGEEMRGKIGALQYMECSAKTNEGVRELFGVATRAAWHAGESQRKVGTRKKIRSLFSPSEVTQVLTWTFLLGVIHRCLRISVSDHTMEVFAHHVPIADRFVSCIRQGLSQYGDSG